MGGVGAVSALGKYGQTGGGRMLAEFGGGMLGDMVGQSVGDGSPACQRWRNYSMGETAATR